MKHPRLIVVVAALVGLVLGVVAGLTWAAFTVCDPSGVAGTCYRYFGRYVSQTTYHTVNGGLVGLGIGLAVGLLIVSARRLLSRHRDSAPNTDST